MLGHQPRREYAQQYSAQTMRSLVVVDEHQVNYPVLVDLIRHIIQVRKARGAGAFLEDWPSLSAKDLQVAKQKGASAGAILVFMPGAPEINRLARMLQEDGGVVSAAGGQSNLRVLPLHGALSGDAQTKVFAR